MKRLVLFLSVCLSALLFSACSGTAEIVEESSPAPEAAPFVQRSNGPPAIRIVEPANGAIVMSPTLIQIETENVELAGVGRVRAGKFHLHLSMDGECLLPGEPIPHDPVHLHAGNGETAFFVNLEPGTHRICAQLGDGFHVALGVVDDLTIVVEENLADEDTWNSGDALHLHDEHSAHEHAD